MAKSTSSYPALTIDTTETTLVSQSGAVLLLRTAESTGLTTALSQSLQPWRKPLAVHDPAKIILDLAVAVAIGGDCLADIAVLREQPRMFGQVASDPTVSRTIDALAKAPDTQLAAINAVRTHSRKATWSAAGEDAPDHDISAEHGCRRHPRAYNSDRTPRKGAWVAEITGMADRSGWPKGMRLSIRKEHPHPDAQLRITDIDGLRVTAFVTNSVKGQLADLELRHRWRARCEDRIRNGEAPTKHFVQGGTPTGLAAFPLYDFAQNQIWLTIVALASKLTAWMQLLALTGHEARKWEPKSLRLRVFSVAARISRHARRTRLRLSANAPWSSLPVTALA